MFWPSEWMKASMVGEKGSEKSLRLVTLTLAQEPLEKVRVKELRPCFLSLAVVQEAGVQEAQPPTEKFCPPQEMVLGLGVEVAKALLLRPACNVSQ